MRRKTSSIGLMRRAQALEVRHKMLEARVLAELNRPLPDAFVLQRLKRLRLVVKEEIASLETLLRAIAGKKESKAA